MLRYTSEQERIIYHIEDTLNDMKNLFFNYCEDDEKLEWDLRESKNIEKIEKYIFKIKKELEKIEAKYSPIVTNDKISWRYPKGKELQCAMAKTHIHCQCGKNHELISEINPDTKEPTGDKHYYCKENCYAAIVGNSVIKELLN